MQTKRSTITRRTVLKIFALAGTGALMPHQVRADTNSDIASAQARLAEAQQKLDSIASEYEALSASQSKTLDELAKVEEKIEEVQKRVKKLEERLKEKQEELARNVSEEYKDGNQGVVGLVVGSSSIEDLISKLYYHGKVTEDQARLIDETKAAKEAVEAEKAELEKQREALAEISKTQEEQLSAMRDKQYEAQQVIEGLDKEVRELMQKRDAEMLAAQQEAEQARKEREAAEAAEAKREEERRAAQKNESSQKSESSQKDEGSQKDESSQKDEGSQKSESSKPSESSTSDDDQASSATVDSDEHSGGATGSASRVIDACYSTPSPGLGLCAGWCSMVMANAGYGSVSGNANDMYAEFCHSSDRSELMPGMAVAVSSHPNTSAGRIYGHIGMYIGGGMMMDNVGEIRTISVDEWCDYYGGTCAPRWGWLNDVVLS